jgi:hypothetical protein
LERLLSLCEKHRPLLRWVDIKFLSAAGLAALTAHLGVPAEWAWGGIADRLSAPPLAGGPVLDSVIVSDFPEIFSELRGKRFSLLWRGGRDGFGADDFHYGCNGYANTLTVILDIDGNVFGGFTPVEWESRVWNWKGGKLNNCYKADESLKSFLFTLKNPHRIAARRFALQAEKKDEAISCNYELGPNFCDIGVSDQCNANTRSFTSFGHSYTNDTGLVGKRLFTSSEYFQVKEIEVFKITD